MTTSLYRDLPVRARAIALMKEGQTADALHTQLVNEGVDPQEVRTVLTELVALQQQAAAMHPERLRGEARWMFVRGATAEQIAEHFMRVGVPEEHARPEAQRLVETFRQMKLCQRCGTPTMPSDFVFDLSGLSICSGCHLADEISRSEHRGFVEDVQLFAGVGLIGALAIDKIADQVIENGALGMGRTQHPFCAHCRQPSGIPVASLPANAPQRQAGWDWACRLCGGKIA